MTKFSAATLLILLALAAPAAAKTETATLGSVRAELSYEKGKYNAAKSIEMKVFADGEQIVGKTIPDKRFFSPVGYHTGHKSVRVRDLDGDGSGDAIFDLYTGGAHCCFVTYIFKDGVEIEQNWGNVGYTLKGGDLISADDRFSGLFSAYAGSIPPLRVLQLTSDAKLTDVTGERSALLRKELREFKGYYRQAVKDLQRDEIYRQVVKAAVAAIAADQCNLNRCSRGYDLAKAAIGKGYLKPKFLGHLRKVLKRFGYDR